MLGISMTKKTENKTPANIPSNDDRITPRGGSKYEKPL